MASFSDYKSYEPGEDPYVALEAIRFNYKLRKVLFISAILLGGFVAYQFKDDLRYYLENRTGPTSLGDARARYMEDRRTITPKNGQYVRYENMIPTVYRSFVTERAGEERPYTEFLSPVLDIVVQTSEGLPAPPPASRLVHIEPKLAGLLRASRANIYNLNVHFTAQGRIYRMDQAPAEFKDLIDYYRPWIRKPLNDAWIIVDGEHPDVRTVWVYLGILIVILFTGFLMIRSRSSIERYRSSFPQ